MTPFHPKNISSFEDVLLNNKQIHREMKIDGNGKEINKKLLGSICGGAKSHYK